VREGVAAAGVPGHQVSNKSPGLALANVQFPYHLRVTNLHPPPPRTALQRHFIQRARNRATNARFWDFGLNHTPASRWRTRSPPGVSMPSTRTHHLPSSPHTAVSHGTPETELQTLGFGFLA
jgi:hypothetical protein